MPMNGYSVGRDITLVIQTPSGPLSLNKITKFTAKQESTEVRVKRLDGITDRLRFFDGWSGGFEIERQDSVVDDYFAQLEANYYAGINEQPCQIYETHTEPNGMTTQYRHDGVLLTLDNAGEWMGDSTVKISLKWTGSRRTKTA
ncbi:hypothetical protein [Paraburkholderia atlantica]|uniref:hypothetical protein n=1 Tax=Paraburkholderia atlantica TaxID=2654982 RepID=UPI00161F6988|nr:hypothetical protein [Paraburkholderia atlantica]MBB5508156.1 hypothetical protein [Paraburkholderia atlantica]